MDAPEKFDIQKIKHAIEADRKAPPLSQNELKAAANELVVKYPKVKRHLVDPPFKAKSKNQKYGMFSWYPSRGAKADVNGIYGTIILRGCEKKVEDLEERSKFLIENVDSKHEYYIAEVGYEKPLSVEAKYARDLKIVEEKVDAARKEKDEALKQDEERARKDMEDRRKALEDDVKCDPNEITLDLYATKKSKLANIRQRYEDVLKELVKCRDIINKTKTEIIDIERTNPEFKDQFIEKMKATFEQSGITIDFDKMKRYMDTELEKPCKNPETSPL